MNHLLDRIFSRPVLPSWVAAVCLALVGLGVACSEPRDWPQFLGPTRDSISKETGLLRKWPPEGPPLVWKAKGLGHGYSSVSVSGGKIFTQGHFGDKEKVLALKEANGSELWSVDVGPAVEVDRPGSRSTPTVDGDFLYAVTVGGVLICLKTDGQKVWRRHLAEDFKGRRGNWGHCESPLVDGNRVICTPGGEEATLVALDKRSGDTIWKASVPQGEAAAHSSVIAAAPHGVRQYIQFFAGGTVGVRASDGKLLWREDSWKNPDQHPSCSSPVYHDGYVFSASAYGRGGALVQLLSSSDGFAAKLKYRTKDMNSHHGGFFLRNGYIYGADAAVLTCIEFLTGKRVWRDRSVGPGSVVYADGHIYFRGTDSAVALVEATPKGYREKGRFDQPDRSKRKAWAYPVIAAGKLYLRDDEILLCYDIRDKPLR